MAEILPRHYLYGVVFFMIMIVGGVSLLSILSAEDSSFNDNDRIGQFNRTFDKMSYVEAHINSYKTNLENADTDPGIFGVLNALISTSWNSMLLLFGSLDFMTSVVYGTESFFGFPYYVPLGLFLFIIITLAFAIFSMIFQKEG